MQLRLRVLLSYQHLGLHPPLGRSQARPAPPQIGRHAQAQHRRRRAVPAPQVPRRAAPVLQGSPEPGERQHRQQREQDPGEVPPRVRPAPGHPRHLVRLVDSFVRETNLAIGRGENGQADGDHVAQVFRIAEWCRKYDIMFKLNTVVNVHNWDEDMVEHIAKLAPFRWKVFQCLIVEGENEDDTRVRDARMFLISEERWKTFCDRHKHLPCYVPEDNQTMAGSYLLLDERMRFLDKGDGPMRKSDSLLDVGVKKAMQQVAWDKEAFDKRGGIYEWRKPQTEGSTQGGCGSGDKKELEW